VIGRDGIAGLACLGGSLWLLVLTRGLPRAALVPIGPAFYPRIVLGVMAALAVLLIAGDVLARRRSRPHRAEAGPRRNYRLVALTFAVFAVYVFALPLLGFRVATTLFVLALQVVLAPAGPRHWPRVIIVAVVTALVTHLVFEGYLSVLLPRGRWTGI
jgi:putative tricarboxylic transport membrane protein